MVGVLESKREQIAAACARHGVLRLDAFGSAVRGDFRPGDSDVDLVMVDAVKNRYLAADIERTKQALYAA
jgi:predicted nucleotidyltransferase